MARIKLEVPDTFSFSTPIPLRITDVNYGGHVGNDTILSLLHEARMRFLQQWGYSEMNMAGVSLIMGDVAIAFKAELFYSDALIAYVTAADFSRVSFDIYYKLMKNSDTVAVIAKTGMLCFNYEAKKIVSVPEAFKEKVALM